MDNPKCDNHDAVTGLDAVQREQLAAQVIAMMQAMFSRPNADEMREVLRIADSQITAQQILSEQAASLSVREPQSTNHLATT